MSILFPHQYLLVVLDVHVFREVREIALQVHEKSGQFFMYFTLYHIGVYLYKGILLILSRIANLAYPKFVDMWQSFGQICADLTFLIILCDLQFLERPHVLQKHHIRGALMHSCHVLFIGVKRNY